VSRQFRGAPDFGRNWKFRLKQTDISLSTYRTWSGKTVRASHSVGRVFSLSPAAAAAAEAAGAL